MFANSSARMNVGRWRKVQRSDRALDVAFAKCRFRCTRAHRRVSDSKKDEPHVAQGFATYTRRGGEPDQCVVAMTARKLGETETALVSRCWDANRSDHFAGRERGLEQAAKEAVCRNPPFAITAAHDDFAAERDDTCRQFGCR